MNETTILFVGPAFGFKLQQEELYVVCEFVSVATLLEVVSDAQFAGDLIANIIKVTKKG